MFNEIKNFVVRTFKEIKKIRMKLSRKISHSCTITRNLEETTFYNYFDKLYDK